MASRFRWLRTARGKSTVAATGVVALSLIVAGFAAVVLQQRALVGAIDTALLARVDDLSALIADGAVPVQLTVPGDDDALVQIVDPDGTVIASSANIGGERRITDTAPDPGTQLVTDTVLPIGEGEYRLVARTITADGRAFTVYAASNLEQITEAIAALSTILAVGVPLLIAFVGVTVWIIIGRTLYPVEAIRSEVATISERQLDRRVPVPNTDDEIGHLAETMNEMLDRLEHASTQQRQFIADASHELRSPLAAIRSQLEVDLVHPESADWPAANAAVLDEALRMQRLVDDLLLLARSESGTLPAHWDAVDVDDVVFAEVTRLTAAEDLIVDTSKVSGAQVIGDESSLARAIGNLLENAVRYAASRVELSLSEAGRFAVLKIEDDGPGIPADTRAAVFDRFARLDEARDRNHGGAGLGLAITKGIVEHHHGTIAIDRSALGGTQATITLPSA